MEIWQRGFSDHRVRDLQDFETHVGDIYRNPVGRKISRECSRISLLFSVSSSTKDEVPQWLKPSNINLLVARLKPCPFKASDDEHCIQYQTRGLLALND